MTEERKLQISKSNPWGIVIAVSCVLLLLFFRYYEQHKDDKYKSTFKGETIGFATRFKYSSKSTYLKYYFYIEDRIVSWIMVPGGNENQLNKFYKVKYDLNNPYENYIILKKELKPDSISLVNAGFTKTKYYIYDGGVSCKYIEKSKWE